MRGGPTPGRARRAEHGPTLPPGSRRPERGAVLPLCALVLSALIIFTSIAVDLGFQRMARRDMQALADVVALDLVRRIDGSTADALAPVMDVALAESVARNTTTVGEPPTVTYRLGVVDGANRFSPVPGDQVPSAVEVTASTSIDYFFRPGEGGATRRAVASSRPEACFGLGSFALNLSSEKAFLLNALIGDALNLGALGYTGLATSSISLLGLATELGLGSVDELVATDVRLDQLVVAAADVLRRQDDLVNADLLDQLVLLGLPTPTISVGDIVNAAPGSQAALEAAINALDLLAAAAFLANGDHALAVPGLALNIGPIVNLTTEIELIESPRRACGPVNTSASTAQLSVTAGGNGVALNLPLVGLGTVAVGVGPLELGLDTAGARGTLDRILCGSVDGTPTPEAPNGIDVGVRTSLLQAGVEIPLTVSGQVSLLGLGLVNVNISLTVSASTNEPDTVSVAQFRDPPQAIGTTLETGAGTVGLSGLALNRTNLSVSATLLPILGGGIPINLTAAQLNSILDPVIAGVVNPLISQLDQVLLGPLTELLGLSVAGADVTWLSPLKCQGPTLVA